MGLTHTQQAMLNGLVFDRGPIMAKFTYFDDDFRESKQSIYHQRLKRLHIH
jgi:hypothetical protein